MSRARLRVVDAAPAAPLASFGNARKPIGIRPYQTGCACPQCGGRSWDVRRATAECTGCAEVLPL